MGGLGVETVGEQSFHHGAISVGVRDSAHHAVVQMHVDLVEEGMQEQVDGTARASAGILIPIGKGDFSFHVELSLSQIQVAIGCSGYGKLQRPVDGHGIQGFVLVKLTTQDIILRGWYVEQVRLRFRTEVKCICVCVVPFRY